MTTYQDQPLSRRAIREREAANARASAEASPTVPPQNSPTLGADGSAAPSAGEQAYRPRDFSPEAIRTAPPSWRPDPVEAAGPDAHTYTSAELSHTLGLTRRELRALREAEERRAGTSQPAPVEAHSAAAPEAPAAAVPPVATPAPAGPPDWLAAFAPTPAAVPEQPAPAAATPPPLIEPVAPQTDALTSFEALLRAQTGVAELVGEVRPEALAAPPAGPVARPLVEAVPAPEPQNRPEPEPVQPVSGFPSAPVFPAPVAPASVAPLTSPVAITPPSFSDYASGIQSPSPFEDVVVPPPSVSPSQEVVPEVVPAIAPAVDERPRNHWSRQAELDDEVQQETGSIVREVGMGPATANALVLPEIPTTDIIGSSLTSTGDVLVTGSISLPASLSSTGALPTQLDESDLDALLEASDQQVSSLDSQPVRAVRAVSTHTSSREIIGTLAPKRSNRALTALIIVAASMAVVVVTLLGVAIASGVLGS